MTTQHIHLYKLECKAFWREYKENNKMNLLLYIVFCLVLYFMFYIATVFKVDYYLILNIYLTLFILNFIGRKSNNKVANLLSNKTRNLCTTPIPSNLIVSLKSLKFTLAFILDCFVIFTPLILNFLLLGFNFKEIILYTLLGIFSGSVILFIKEYAATVMKDKTNFSFVRTIFLGIIISVGVSFIDSIIKNPMYWMKNYHELFNQNLSVYTPYLCPFFILTILLRNKAFIILVNNREKGASFQHNKIKSQILTTGEVTKQIILANREAQFFRKYLNTILMYLTILLTQYLLSERFNNHNSFLFRPDIYFFISIVIAEKNIKVFFNSREIYNEKYMIYSYLSSKYKISTILLYRALINIFVSLTLNLFFMLILLLFSNHQSKDFIVALMISILYSVVLSLIQEYYLANNVSYFVSIGNENKISLVKRILWESFLTLLIMYSYIVVKIINIHLLIPYSVVLSFTLLTLGLIFTLKIMRGNKKFYGELKDYF